MDKEISDIKISVRNLVEFLLRSGDLSAGGAGVKNTDAMLEGSRIHRKIQRSRGTGYEAEVPLRIRVPIDVESDAGEPVVLTVEGRADGIDREREPVMVEEIKGTYRDPSELKEAEPVHLAQALCYAYILLHDEKRPAVAVQITYCHMETEEMRSFLSEYTAKEITEWFNDLIEQYTPWAVYEYEWNLRRNRSIGELKFPFSYRPGQDDLVAYTYRQMRDGGILFIEAPTGVGKTISTVFPAVKLMGEGKLSRLFYLTAKTVTRAVAEDCFRLLGDGGLKCKPITLTAKEKLCVLPKPDCDPAACERAKGHYDRVNDALYDLLTNEERITRDIVNTYADKHTVCPFELSLDAALFADAVIGDYNYVFDPNVYLRRFFGAQKKGDMALLIDEAHNLVERGRAMYSAAIVKEDFLTVARRTRAMIKKEHRPDALYAMNQFVRALESVNRSLLSLKRECERFSVIELPEKIAFSLLRVVAAYEQMASEGPVWTERETFVEFYFSVRNFLAVWEVYDDHYRTCADYTEDGAFRITLQCMDPSRRLREVCERAGTSVFFSATLLPIRYYKEQLGGTEEDPAVYAKSSFAPGQRRILIARDVTSRYKSRGPVMYQRIAAYIERFIGAKPGNYLIFFPSYPFLQEVQSCLTIQEDYTLLVQDRNMAETEREAFLKEFEQGNRVGLCVMGGVFAEGIDLTGDRLIGAAIVGTGLPMVCDERELFKKYYDEMGVDGFDYAYLYPGLGKVFQAGGRVIRTATDRGVVLLLDDRFLRQEILNEFPREWRECRAVSIDTLTEELQAFWDEI